MLKNILGSCKVTQVEYYKVWSMKISTAVLQIFQIVLSCSVFFCFFFLFTKTGLTDVDMSTWLSPPQPSSAQRPSSAPSGSPPAPPPSGGSGQSWWLLPLLSAPAGVETLGSREQQPTGSVTVRQIMCQHIDTITSVTAVNRLCSLFPYFITVLLFKFL